MSGVRHLRQLVRHDPPRSYGDCDRTCVAMLLGCEPSDLPHWLDENEFGANWRKVKREALAERGCGLVSFALDLPTMDGVLDTISEWCIGPVALAGKSPRGEWNHIVVVDDGRILDPHPDDTGLTGPCLEGHWWVEALTRLPTPGAE